MRTMNSRLLPVILTGFLLSFCLGCGGKDVPAKTEFNDQDKKQIEELNKQRVDEWGRKVK
jgi:hypothetical protein